MFDTRFVTSSLPLYPVLTFIRFTIYHYRLIHFCPHLYKVSGKKINYCLSHSLIYTSQFSRFFVPYTTTEITCLLWVCRRLRVNIHSSSPPLSPLLQCFSNLKLLFGNSTYTLGVYPYMLSQFLYTDLIFPYNWEYNRRIRSIIFIISYPTTRRLTILQGSYVLIHSGWDLWR